MAAAGQGYYRDAYGARPSTPNSTDQRIQARQNAVDQAGRIIARLRGHSVATGTDPTQVLIYAHGGLISHATAVSNAERLAPALLDDDYFPVFLIWDSGLFQNYGNYLMSTNSRGEIDSDANGLLSPFRLAGDVATSLAQSPENLVNQVVRYNDTVLRGDHNLYSLPACLHGDSSVEPADPTMIQSCECDPSQVGSFADCAPASRLASDGTTPEQMSNLWQNQYRALPTADPFRQFFPPEQNTGRRPNTPRNVIFPPFYRAAALNPIEQSLGGTITYTALGFLRFPVTLIAPESGANSWDSMVGQTRMVTRVPQEVAVPDRGLPPAGRWSAEGACEHERYYPGDAGTFAIFFYRLECEIDQERRNPSNDGVSALGDHLAITFVGHSMGSLVGNDLISSFPQLPYERVIYMAAATSIREFNHTIAHTMLGQSLGCSETSGLGSVGCFNFYNLSLHPLTESRELQMGGVTPQGSLLEWIDEMLVDPRGDDERTLGKWTNLWRTMETIPLEVRNRMVVRVFPHQSQIEPSLFEAWCEPLASYEGDSGRGMEREVADTMRHQARCHPRKHGEFSRFSFWREQFLLGEFARPNLEE